MTEDAAATSGNPHDGMPVPGTPNQSYPASASSGGEMPEPAMSTTNGSGTTNRTGTTNNPAATDGMPRPGEGGSTPTGGGMAEPANSSPGQMPRPSTGTAPDGSTELPRFIRPDGAAPAPSYEAGVVEVQFRHGVMPTVSAPTGAEATIASAADTPLDDVNRILQDHGLLSAEPTFETTHEEATAVQASAVAQGIDAPHLAHFVTLHFPDNADVRSIADELASQPEVELAAPVPVALPPTMVTPDVTAAPAPAPAPTTEDAAPPTVPADPLIGTSDVVVVNPVTHLENQWYIHRCHANQAWPRASGLNVVIADVDWGCRTSHQDLSAGIERTYNAFDGTADVTHGGSVFHGTGVAGITGAVANGVGIAGFGQGARLWIIQGDSGTSASLGGNAWARGIDWVRTTSSGGRRKVVILEVQTGAFGNYEQVASVNAAIKTAIAAGVVVCVAAGNGNKDAGLDDSGNAIPVTGSILVGATGYDAAQNKRAWFSNYGPRVVVCAPGDSDHDLTCDSGSDSAYRNNFGGTSGATPKVAGVAALMLSTDATLTHADIRSILTLTGTAVTPDPGKPVGPFLNASGAVQQAGVGAVGRMEIFARGSDKAVWHKWQTAPNSGWSGWSSLGGWVDLIESGRNADGRLELFVRGSDHAVWHMWQTAPNSGWSGWASMGGWVDLLSVSRNADGRMEVFARGSDKAVWHNWQTAPNSGWSGWASLGGWIDQLTMGQNQDGRMEVFARGADGAVWHNWQTAPNSGWSGWASLGGWIDRLEVGRNADGRMEVFARGADGALWHNWQTTPNGGWSGWASLGGWIDLLAVGRNADGRMEVFARGSDKAVWHNWQTTPNGGWSGWASLGGWIDQLTVNQNQDGRLEIFARGGDSALWHNWQTSPNGGWSGWASLGGWIDILHVAQNAA